MENVGQTCKIKDFSQTKPVHLGGKRKVEQSLIHTENNLYDLKEIYIEKKKKKSSTHEE